jgi:hypothetical protein
MEVDNAAALELRDLDKRDSASPGELGRGQTCHLRQRAAEGDGESAPELGGVPVERDVRGVVVAVRADRLPESRVIIGVNGRAPGWPTVLAQLRLTLGWAAPR